MKQWVISAMECKPKEGDLNDVVITIHWRRHTEQDGYRAEVYSTYSCPTPDGEFTPYESLTKEQVEGWLNSGLDVESIDASLDSMIESQINPAVINLPLPW